ncbi:retropepsin-like aspartic protease family protein [Bosea sp. (in: a-proteobacteria)]|uniref:retropepsin-like aspartic protease family protein n=1 Tax=Bosea sp. (in: a-proteobacteria) TaxID=1871050 RepID=UPI003B3ACE4B
MTNWALAVAAAVTGGAVGYTQWLAPKVIADAPQASIAASAAPAAPRTPPTLTVAADSRGHYLVHPTIDNYRVRMMVDTGASIVALKAEDAAALGLKAGSQAQRMPLNTANGVVMGYRTTIREIRLGEITVRNVDAVVLPPGALGISLLGNSFLGKLNGYQVQTGRMILRG